MNDEQVSAPQGTSRRRHDVFLPLLLTLIGVVLWMGFQATQLWMENSTLSRLSDKQEATLRTAQGMRQQLNALASGVAKLAQAGNPNAKLIVNDLRRRGITINPSAIIGEERK